MRIGLAAFGSEGDLRPMLALAAGLAEEGHTVRLDASGIVLPVHHALAERYGITFREAGVPTGAVKDEMSRRMEDAIFRGWDPAEGLVGFLEIAREHILPHQEAAAETLVEQSDVLVAHFLCQSVLARAEARGKPRATVALSPGMLPSAWEAVPGLPPLGRVGNRLLWWFVEKLMQRSMGPYINPVRAGVGLPPARSVFGEAWVSPMLHLVAVNPLFSPRRPDWPEQAVPVGAFTLPDEGATTELLPELEAFLAEGEAPVLFSFGSVTPTIPHRIPETLTLFTEAIETAGCRALVQLGPEVPAGLELPDGVMAIGRAPFDALMPRCAATVHHGGSGTFQTAIRSGRPQVIVPHMVDQFAWAQTARHLGVAGKAVARRKLTGPVLGRLVRETLEDGGRATRAKEVGAAAAEAGAGLGATEAVRRIEALAG